MRLATADISQSPSLKFVCLPLVCSRRQFDDCVFISPNRLRFDFKMSSNSDASIAPLPPGDDDDDGDEAFRRKTYLAPLVHCLICEVGMGASASPKEPCLLSNGLIDWEALNSALQEDIDSWDTKKDFSDIVNRVAPLCLDIHEHVMALSLSDLEQTYSEWIQWTGCPDVFLEGFQLLKEDNDIGPSISLLMTTAALERALGDVFLLRNKPCPSLLKDLLVTQELQSFFGWQALYCLRVLMGPPTSLNLRNILWHGFASPGEIPSRYSSFLLVLTASLGYRLNNQGIHTSSIPHRTQIDFQKHIPLLKNKFPVLIPSDLDLLSKVMFQRGLICHSHKSLWLRATHCYKIERYNLCVMIPCPLLEHLIRLKFAKANKCPERVLTAESTVLFTTFDEMLCAELNDGNPNLLIPALSEPYMDLLMDLLIHPDGPRLRDRISHGEVDVQGVPRELVSFTICVLLACSMKADRLSCQNLSQVPLLEEILDQASSYTSVFHPVSTCRHLIHSVALSLNDWSSLPRPIPQDLDYIPWGTGPVEGQPEERTEDRDLVLIVLRNNQCFNRDGEDYIVKCIIHTFQGMEPLTSHLNSLHLQTLFRPRKELEVAGLLHRIAAECLKVNDQIRSLAATRFGQWQGKELRSRQRTNYQRFLNRIPRIGTGLRFALLLLTSHLSLIDQVSMLDKLYIPTIKFLKVLLQYVENLTTLTSIEKNKWDASAQLTEDFLDRVRKHYSKMTEMNPDSSSSSSGPTEPS